jgi:hypothetical protein
MESDTNVSANKVAPRISPRESPYGCVNLSLVWINIPMNMQVTRSSIIKVLCGGNEKRAE